MGHYQISRATARGSAPGPGFPSPRLGLNARTNLYYVETHNAGKTWTTIDGRPLVLPLTAVKNPALVRDYQAEGLLVYMKDMAFDEEKHPVNFYLTSRNYAAGPKSGPQLCARPAGLATHGSFTTSRNATTTTTSARCTSSRAGCGASSGLGARPASVQYGRRNRPLE